MSLDKMKTAVMMYNKNLVASEHNEFPEEQYKFKESNKVISIIKKSSLEESSSFLKTKDIHKSSDKTIKMNCED